MASRRAAVVAVLPALVALAACESRTLEAYPHKLGGVGVVLNRDGGGFVITKVVAGGPADEAGVHAGDRLLAVNGEPSRDRTLAQIVESLRGDAGTDVLLRVGGEHGEVNVVVHRRTLEKKGAGYEAVN